MKSSANIPATIATDDLVERLKTTEAAFRAGVTGDDDNGELAEWFRPAFLRDVAKDLRTVIAALAEGRDASYPSLEIVVMAGQLCDKLGNLAASHPQHGTHYGRAKALLDALHADRKRAADAMAAEQGPSIVEAELQRVSELLVDHFGETTRASVSEHLADVIAKQKRQGPSDGEMLEFVCENAFRFVRLPSGCVLYWTDSDTLEQHRTEGTDWHNAITNAMTEERAMQASKGAEGT